MLTSLKLIGGLLLLALPWSVHAGVFLSDENAISLPAEIDDDVYAVGNTIFLNKQITGDIFAAGQTVSVPADAGADVFAAAEQVEISGRVGDDIAAAGNTIRIASPASDDLFAVGNEIIVTKETVVSGDAYLAGQSIELAGTFDGDVRAAGESIVLKTGASIKGNLRTYGDTAPVIEAGVTITGERRHEQSEVYGESPRARVYGSLASIVSWFIAGLAALYLLPQFTAVVVTTSATRAGRAGLLAILGLVLLIPICILLALTLVGLPLMFVVLFAAALVVVVGIVYANLLLGHLIMHQLLKNTAPLSWQHVLLGSVVFELVTFVPVIGSLVNLALVLWAVGSLMMSGWATLRGHSPASSV